MRINCPMCGFAREIDEAKVPARAQMATCPKCTHKFRFRVVDDLEPAPAFKVVGSAQNTNGGFLRGTGQPSAPDSGQAQQDPMSAQRTSAAEAWKRLQGPQASQPKAPDATEQPRGLTPQSPEGTAQPLDSGEPLPTESGAPLQVGSPVPFEDLPRHGFFPGLWGTIRMILTSPAVFFRSMPPQGGMAKPLVFHLLLAEFMIVCQYLWSMAGIGATAEYLGSPELMDLGLDAASAAPALLFLVYPLLLVLRLMLMTGIIHLLLRMVRSGGSGAEGTFRVLCYSAAPLLLGILPGVGPLIGGVWSIGLTILGLREVHRSRLSAAMFAVLVPILMMLAALLGLMQGMVQAG